VPVIEAFDIRSAISEYVPQKSDKYNLSKPDAIQLVLFIEAGANYFFINDNRLKIIKDTTVVTVAELQYQFCEQIDCGNY
jgi:hypothetical protein